MRTHVEIRIKSSWNWCVTDTTEKLTRRTSTKKWDECILDFRYTHHTEKFRCIYTEIETKIYSETEMWPCSEIDILLKTARSFDGTLDVLPSQREYPIHPSAVWSTGRVCLARASLINVTVEWKNRTSAQSRGPRKVMAFAVPHTATARALRAAKATNERGAWARSPKGYPSRVIGVYICCENQFTQAHIFSSKSESIDLVEIQRQPVAPLHLSYDWYLSIFSNGLQFFFPISRTVDAYRVSHRVMKYGPAFIGGGGVLVGVWQIAIGLCKKVSLCEEPSPCSCTEKEMTKTQSKRCATTTENKHVQRGQSASGRAPMVVWHK